MRKIQLTVMILLAFTLFAGAADAQRRVRKPAVVVPPLDVRTAREKVDIQLTNVNRFLDKFGPIAQSVEILDKAAAEGRLDKAGIARNEATKQKLIVAIRDLKAGLATLESEFRTKPILAKYLPKIQGTTDLAAQAEDSAIAGKFVAAKEPLRGVSAKLTDTLATLPK
jgi:hypothetical protein